MESESQKNIKQGYAFWHSISFKMTTAVALILGIVLGVATYFSLQYEIDLEFREVKNYTNRVAELVMHSFESQTIGTKPVHTRYLAAKLLELPHLYNLRVVAVDRTIQFSRDPDDIGKKLFLFRRETCKNCHSPIGIKTHERTYRTDTGSFLYHLPYPIPNQPKCHRCHKPEYKVLGTLIVEMEIDSTLDKLYKHSSSMITASLLALLLAVIGVAITFNWLVKKPLLGLRKDMKKVKYGDFRVGPAPLSRGEIKELYEYFISMTEMLEMVQAKLNARVQEKSAKVDDLSREIRSIYSNLMRMEHLSAIGTLSAQVVHEIRTPLNALSLNLQLLHRSMLAHSDMDTDSQDLAANIGKEVERISAILDNFMDRARRPRSKPTLELVSDLIMEVVGLMEWEAKKIGVDFVVDVEKGMNAVLVQADELRQVLINLFANALHAMPSGGLIKVMAEKSEKACRVTVADTGSGIDENDIGNIFKPFYTTRSQGTGLGLAIVKQIIEGMGGTIRVESAKKEGCRFILELPVDRSEFREDK